MIMSRPDPSIAVRALKSAAPYIRMYKNKVFVIKAGGAVFSDEISTRALIEQVAILHQVGIKTAADRSSTACRPRSASRRAW
jgi:acetylglutamate kinase